MFFHEQHQCIANLPFLFDKGRVDCPVVCAYFILQQLTMLHSQKKVCNFRLSGDLERRAIFLHIYREKLQKEAKKSNKKTQKTHNYAKKGANCAILKLWILHETANYLPPTLSQWQSRSLVQKNAAKRRKM